MRREARNEEIISKLNPMSIGILIALTAALGIAMFVSDLYGKGLADSMYYRLFGPLLYPIFYGAIGYALFEFIRTLRRASRFVVVSADHLHVSAWQPIALGSIRSVEAARNWLGLNEVRVMMVDGSTRAIKSYLLKSPANDVVSKLRKLVAVSNAS
jgi:hypothetical protein